MTSYPAPAPKQPLVHPFEIKQRQQFGTTWISFFLAMNGVIAFYYVFLLHLFSSFSFTAEAMNLATWTVPLAGFLLTFSLAFLTIPVLVTLLLINLRKRRVKMIGYLFLTLIVTAIACGLAILIFGTVLHKMSTINIGYYIETFTKPYFGSTWDKYVQPYLPEIEKLGS